MTRVLDNKGKWQDKDTNVENSYNFGNMKILKDISLGRDNEETKMKTFNSGDKTVLHIPKDLDKVMMSSRKDIASQFAKDNELGKYRSKSPDIEKIIKRMNLVIHFNITTQK